MMSHNAAGLKVTAVSHPELPVQDVTGDVHSSHGLTANHKVRTNGQRSEVRGHWDSPGSCREERSQGGDATSATSASETGEETRNQRVKATAYHKLTQS